MKLLPKLLLIGLSLNTLAVFAESGGVGNGGDILECGTDREVVLLDSYEARKLHLNLNLDNHSRAEQTLRSMVDIAVKRLNKKDIQLASLLYDYSMEMVNDFEKFEKYPDARGKHVYIGYDIIGEINDSKHVSLPEGCKIKQLVSQKKPKFRLEYRYQFAKSLWERMPLFEKAMTILHEAWYRIMLENGAEDSVAARYMNGLIASEEFEQFSFSEYLQELKETELKTYTVINKSDALRTKVIEFDLKKHTLNFKENEVCAPNFIIQMNIKESYSLLKRKQKMLKKTKYQNVCFQNSKLTRVVLPLDVVDLKRTLRLPFHQVQMKKATSSTPTIYFEDGKLLKMEGMSFAKATEMYYICDGKKTFDKREGCEAGPFNFNPTIIENPDKMEFDPKLEVPLIFKRS